MGAWDDRLEAALMSVAQYYAPKHLPPEWRRPGDYSHSLVELAQALTHEGVLLLIGDLPAHVNGADDMWQVWLADYAAFYRLVCATLFPTTPAAFDHRRVGAKSPPMFVIVGQLHPVIEMMGRWVVPFVQQHQGHAAPKDAAFSQVMRELLRDLHAADLPHDDFMYVRDEGVTLLRQMLAQPVRLVSLRGPRRLQEPPPPPDSTPEPLTPPDHTAHQELSLIHISAPTRQG
ncbi:MAG: hypothetical protein GYB67_15850, partial [Chloroflexi bacterium]|nr:hypothetical protein [Chloroflexota bacterium]